MAAKHTSGKRGRGQKRKHWSKHHDTLNKKQKSHYKQFGESHPADDRETGKHRYKKVEDEKDFPKAMQKIPEVAPPSSSSDSEEEVTDYQQLLSTFNQAASSSGTEDDIDSDEGAPSDQDSLAEDNVSSEDEEESAALGDKKLDSSSEDGDDAEDEKEDEDSEDAEEEPGEDYREDDDLDEDATEDSQEVALKENDPFSKHFEVDIPDDLADSLPETASWHKEETEVGGVGRTILVKPKGSPKPELSHTGCDLRQLYVKQILCNQVKVVNKKFANAETKENEGLTKFQQSLFSVVNNYQDLLYMDRTHENGEEIRLTYCIHAVNHILKTRGRVIAHNSKIKSKKDEVPDEYRDQGLTRPKVLIVLPFRDSALRAVNMISALLMANDQTNISNKKRFQKEYGIDQEVKRGLKPEDYEATFAGNIDDHFRIGLGIAKKSLKLYTPFYMSDIILASPLGLRTVIGAEGEKERDFDFLSSIEVLIFDQMDTFMMQNWDHINHLLTHLNLQPKESHGVDFSRVRMWTLGGFSKYYRQTLMFSSIILPEINSIFNKHCHNYSGKFQVIKNPTSGSICHIVVQLPQVFHRVPVTSYADMADARFEFFKTKLLPDHKSKSMAGTLIFIPSYFDFVRIRNLFRKEELSFQKLCEYTVDKSITRARSFFYHGKTHFLLFTERLHFFRRFRIRGIKHLIFYDLPTYAHFYSEVANMIIDPKRKHRAATQNYTCEVMYTKYDVHKLGAVVGTDRAIQMINSEKNTHMLLTGDS